MMVALVAMAAALGSTCRVFDPAPEDITGTATGSELVYQVTQAAKRRKVAAIHARVDGTYQQVWPKAEGPRLGKAISDDALHVAKWAMGAASEYVEYDLRVQVKGTTYLPVSVRLDDAGLWLEEGLPATPYPEGGPSPEAVRSLRGVLLAEMVQQGDAVAPSQELGEAWSPTRLWMLDIALALLSADELDAAKPLGFVRDPFAELPASEEHRAGRYLVGKGLVMLYDDGLLGDARTFTGAAAQPLPTFVRRVLHEVGHAFLDAPMRRGQASTRLQRFEALPGASEPLVSGIDSPEARFAEAFALFHTDPEAVQRCRPEVHAWFASGGHLAP